MLILGHVGITFGVALAAESLRPLACHPASHTRQGPAARLAMATASLARRADLRVLLIGSLLPDIIDKPIGLLLLPGVFGTGRLYCHSLLFPAALALSGIALYRTRASTHLLVLSYGAAMHLALDSMWHTPAILFWPFAGPLPRGTGTGDWVARILTTLLTDPAAYLPEIAGAILIVPLLWTVFHGVGLRRFLLSGDVN
jgi:inner membrane protein